MTAIAAPQFTPPPPAPASDTRATPDAREVESHVAKQAELSDALRHLHAVVEGVHGTVLATRDGLPLASTLTDASTETVAAMAATVMALADQAVPSDGGVEGYTVIRGSAGCLVVQGAGAAGVLAVQTGAHPNLGLVQMEAPAVAATLATALAGNSC